MLNSKIHPIWHAVGPKEWPTPPATMSFSKLFEIEACPRRWALGSARYPQIWDRLGYPGKFHLAANIGRIIHLALEKITRTFATSDCRSVNDTRAIAILKELGGYTKIIDECIQSVLTAFLNNPRVKGKEQIITRTIQSKVAAIRESVQMILNKMQLIPKHGGYTTKASGHDGRSRLGFGSYPEVYLSDDKSGWAGVADLISISETECHIIDFKTGKPRKEHPFQLQIYSLLWMRDSKVNPSALPATTLTLVYRDAEEAVPVLTPQELAIFESELLERTQTAVLAVSTDPPEASPGLDNCSNCEIRQLCEDYWSPFVQQRLGEEALARPEKSDYGDSELTIASRHGPSSWDAVTDVSRHITRGKNLLLRTSPDGPEFRIGDRVRVLDGRLAETTYDEAETLVMTLNSRSEVFLLPY